MLARRFVALLVGLSFLPAPVMLAGSTDGASFEKALAGARAALLDRHGDGERARIDKGFEQVRRVWRPEDGTPEELAAFVQAEFLPEGETLDATFERLEFSLERMGGYMTSLVRDLRRGADLEIGPMLPLDGRLAALDPGAHLSDDLFASKIAFVVLLNFPGSTLGERLGKGDGWSRRRWAEARMTDAFATRVPAEVSQRWSAAMADADSYINAYNIYMHHLLTPDGRRPFPEGLRLISHWGLRDELKAHYAGDGGLEKQRLIQAVMERIVHQEIPEAVVNNPLLDWEPVGNTVTRSTAKDAPAPPGSPSTPSDVREPDRRYEKWRAIFQAAQAADPYHPDNPSLVERRFNVNREIPESEVERLFTAVLSSPLGKDVARLVEKRLGRPLEPFDVWYVGFKPRGRYSEEDLDRRTRERYPTADAYAADIPRLLVDLGFSDERARFLAERIVVEPSRGAGHAFGAGRRDDKAHLRTRVGENGMDYKGYNIAVHEMGHNVEQVFSMTTIDRTLLEGVPNTAFTEALAFVFQNRDLELLGLGGDGADGVSLHALESFWATREIAGVGLVDMAAWRWLYDNPEATAAEFRAAVVKIASDIWNRYNADLFGRRDVPILAVYSHMVDAALYTPDYPLGHLIAFQIEDHFHGIDDFGAEFERICRQGRLTPDAWMRGAVGAPVSAEPLLAATKRAVAAMADDR